MIEKFTQRLNSGLTLAILLALLITAVVMASDVDVAVVDVTVPVNSVTLAPGESAAITINMTVTGRQDGTATFEVYRNWSLSGGTFVGSNPQEFSVPPRAAGAPATTFTTSGTVSVAAGQAAGTFTLAVGAFDITNSNITGAKLSAGDSSNYQVIVSPPADTTPPVIMPTVTGTMGLNGWYTSNVGVTWSVTDAQSAITSTTGCGPTTITADTTGMTLTCSATSAGGTSSNSVTIKRDATAPTISAAVTPIRPASGWWNIASGAPTVTYTCADATSGIATCTLPRLFGEGADQSHTGTAQDMAGNTASTGVSDIDVDLTAPTISAAVTPIRPASGWWNIASGAPTVTYTCADATSGIDTCTPPHLFVEGADQSHTGTAQDMAGNTASTGVSDIDVDLTAPTISAAVTPIRPTSGWWNIASGAPTVTYTCADATSGIATCTTPHLFVEGADQSHTGTAKDMAGNTASISVSDIDVDLTAPTISAALDELPAASGWFNSTTGAPTVSFTCSDGLSGLDGPCPGDFTFGEGENQAHSQTVSDIAGNSATAGVSNIDVDLTAPTITAALDELPAASGWFNSTTGAPTVSFTCSDGLSGLAGPCPGDFTFGEGENQIHSQTVSDIAGNSATAGVSNIDVDLTAPTISAAVAPARPASGWWNIASGAPTVTYTCADVTSGIDTCTPPHLFGQGENQIHTGTAQDKAGNTASTGVSDIDVDLTAPTLTWIGGPASGGSFYFGFVPAAPTCSAADALSGPHSCSVAGYSTAVGAHTMTATALDVAGNSHSEQRSYNVLRWRLFGFYRPVDMGGVVNTVRGGSTVPLKFEVFTDVELTTTSIITMSATRITCSAGLPEAEVELLATGNTSLRYDLTEGQFIFNWQTPRLPNTCYAVRATTADGSVLEAFFRLR